MIVHIPDRCLLSYFKHHKILTGYALLQKSFQTNSKVYIVYISHFTQNVFNKVFEIDFRVYDFDSLVKAIRKTLSK